MKTTILLPRALALLLLGFAFVALPKPAMAQFSIKSPVVEKGEVEIEDHSAFGFGLPRAAGEEGPSQQGHEVSVGYGFTDFWQSELSLTLEKARGEGLEATELAIENTFQLGTYKPWNATFGFLATVALGVGGDEPDAFEFGPMVQFGDENRSLI